MLGSKVSAETSSATASNGRGPMNIREVKQETALLSSAAQHDSIRFGLLATTSSGSIIYILTHIYIILVTATHRQKDEYGEMQIYNPYKISFQKKFEKFICRDQSKKVTNEPSPDDHVTWGFEFCKQTNK
ncbi:hypothetical protein PoB_003749800 [Plakobranchus ocellatus]|uniref:Uncharacterized protein n=1 Tax=Plakobranchus ocellatus TaxID=259542 RepID=A0AAV4AWV0_9GAST|nr:hypothetical protein PoB_003749800 [Plakobranchus ocellatus]